MWQDVIAVDSLSRAGSERNWDYLKNNFPKIRCRQRETEDIFNLDLWRAFRSSVSFFGAGRRYVQRPEILYGIFVSMRKAHSNIAKAASDIGRCRDLHFYKQSLWEQRQSDADFPLK
jgi:hypothetical protein